MNNTTVKLVLDGKNLADGKQSIYLLITKNKKRLKLSLGIRCKKEHFKNEKLTKRHPNYNQENELLLKFKLKAIEIIRSYQLDDYDFSLKEFKDKFRNTVGDKQNKSFLEFVDEIIEELKQTGKISTKDALVDTRNSLVKFYGKNIDFQDIDLTFIEKYEAFLRSNGSTNGGIAFRMRELKSIINKARKRGIIPKEPYAFEDYNISKLKSENTKRALNIEDFIKFRDVDLSLYPHLKEAHNYFLFSIYTRGMNFHDMMFLKWSDIRNGRIYYTRSKTKGKLNLEIIAPAQEIIDNYKKEKRPTKYVFPILLNENMTPQQIADRKHKVLSRYNRKLKEIAKIANIDSNLTSYVARHSFATILKMSGTSIEKISEMMGHSDVSITIAYLKDFSDSDLDLENRKFSEL